MQTFAALADPTRRRIVELLASGSLTAGEIAGHFPLTAPAISQHLKTLRQARLVRMQPLAQQRIYQIDPEGLAELSAWLKSIQAFWSPRLDRLEAAIKESSQNKR